jgi:hypothetical protein
VIRAFGSVDFGSVATNASGSMSRISANLSLYLGPGAPLALSQS